MAFQVLEQCRISPPSGSVSRTSLPLTIFDLPWFIVPPVQRVFFYELDVSKPHFIDSTLPNLKHSLSLTLQHFYPLAGNLTWPAESTVPQILYTDGDSILLTVAESNQNFHLLIANHPRDASEFYPLAPKFEPMTPTEKRVPLLCLQVTVFPNKGICVGITVNHVAADGRTSNLFMKFWASACRLGDDNSNLSSLTPFYNRNIVEEHKDIIEEALLKGLEKVNITKNAFNSSILPTHAAENLRATFVLSRPDFIKLKQWVLKKKQLPEELRLSTFVLTCAYVWVCLIKSRLSAEDSTEVGEDRMECFGFPMDCRDQINPPLPVTYFGNCFIFCATPGGSNDLLQEDGVATAAVLIAKAIQNTRNESWPSLETCFSSIGSIDMKRVVSVAGSPKLAVYQTDFGWGKPKKVEVISIGRAGAISISECPEEVGAIEVGLVLSKIEMDTFASQFVNTIKSIP